MHYHFIRECVQAGAVDLQHLNTNLQVADIFTKALGIDKLRQFVTNLGLLIIDQPRLRGALKNNISRCQTGFKNLIEPTFRHPEVVFEGRVENRTQLPIEVVFTLTS